MKRRRALLGVVAVHAVDVDGGDVGVGVLDEPEADAPEPGCRGAAQSSAGVVAGDVANQVGGRRSRCRLAGGGGSEHRAVAHRARRGGDHPAAHRVHLG